MSATKAPLERSSVLKVLHTKKFYTLVALAALIGDTMRVSHPVDPPPVIAQNSGTSVPHPPPSPEMDIETLMESIDTVEDLTEFLDQHVKILGPGTLWEFLRTFRQDPEGMQENDWTGPCNNVVEFHGRFALQHGGKPYLVTIYPVGFRPKFRKSWHQMIVCKTAPDHLVIFDNHSAIDYDGTFEKFLQEHYAGMTVLPVGGVIPWTGTVPDAARAKILDLFQWNVPEEEFEFWPLPRRNQAEPPRGPFA
ncbi:MAG: hypothetical protein WC840_02665 [Candidatus Peribacteraceae bacterium]